MKDMTCPACKPINDCGRHGDPRDTSILNEKVRAAAKVEADRQGCDQAGYERLLVAYENAWNFYKGKFRFPFERWLLNAAWILEAQNENGYRTTPVTFDHGGYAVSADVVPAVTHSLFNAMREAHVSGFMERDSMVNAFIKEFLVIHPFKDGNGRLAWIMRVWLKKEWLDPSPLPEYTFM